MKGGQTGNLTCLGTGTLLIMALIEILLVSKLFKPNQMISRDIQCVNNKHLMPGPEGNSH